VKNDTVTLEALCAPLDNLSELAVEGVSKPDVTDNTALEEGERANALGAVDDLIRDNKIHGLDLLLERAYGGEGDDGADADVTQGCNVGAVGHLVRSELVVDAMASQESDVGVVVSEDVDG
jgi:hypothetical protein